MRNTVISFTLCALLFTLGPSASAQQAAKIPRIGVLRADSPGNPMVEAFKQGFRELGYIEGKNIFIEYRYAEGKVDRFPDLAAELVRMKVDVIVAAGDAGARAAKNATKTIPIVMFGVGTDPVERGLVESYARPGGNITGFTVVAVEIAGKRLELFKEAIPKLVRVAVIYDPANSANVLHVKEVKSAAAPLNLTVESWGIKSTEDFEKRFAVLSKDRPDGLYMTGGPLMRSHQKRVTSFALKSRLPSMYDSGAAVEAGGIISYATDLADQNRRAAIYVDKILKGVKPGDLPVERPTKFELVINLKTAKQIGVTIPQSVLYRADKVIR